MNDRGIIKWAPFSSVINGNILLKEIHEEKSRIIKPTLSEEQIQELEDKILKNIFKTHTHKDSDIYKGSPTVQHKGNFRKCGGEKSSHRMKASNDIRGKVETPNVAPKQTETPCF